ncbi:hypothetical protein [Brevundimonas sp.]|uniref:hypothetical protein n=1 Tax=Brevundimonas sp. TaxID=1871086 RepID=UPI003D0F6D5C
MSAYWIGVIVGAVIFTYLWSRLWLWLVGRVVKADTRRVVTAYGIAWLAAVVLGAFGFADDSGPAWLRALSIYTPSLALWLVVDLLARRGRKG